MALGLFALLQVRARSQRQRWSALADWRTWPPGYEPRVGVGDPVAGQHEGSAYRPGYGFLPGHGLAAPPARSVGGRWMRDPARLGYLCQDVANVRKGPS